MIDQPITELDAQPLPVELPAAPVVPPATTWANWLCGLDPRLADEYSHGQLEKAGSAFLRRLQILGGIL